TRRTEIDWLYRGAARFFPEEWQRFRALVDDDDVVGGYARLLEGNDSALRARAWRNGSGGRMRSSLLNLTASRTPISTSRRTANSPSSASALTTSPTPPGSRKTSSCAMHPACTGSPA